MFPPIAFNYGQKYSNAIGSTLSSRFFRLIQNHTKRSISTTPTKKIPLTSNSSQSIQHTSNIPFFQLLPTLLKYQHKHIIPFTTLTTTAAATTLLIKPNSIPNQHETSCIDFDDIETVEDFYQKTKDVEPEIIFPNLPIYTLTDIQSISKITNPLDHDKRIIIIQGDYIYDLTEFVDVHPGGNKILEANFNTADPFWLLYPIHKQSPIVWQVLNEYRIGILHPNDRKIEKEKLIQLEKEFKAKNQWKYEPIELRHNVLRYLSKQPCNAETPLHLIYNQFITPISYFFIRNHHPIPVTPQSPPIYHNVTNNDKQEEDEQQRIDLVYNEYGIPIDNTTKTWFLPHEELPKYPITFEINKKLYDNGTFHGQTNISIPYYTNPTQTKNIEFKYNPTTDNYETILTIGDLMALLPQESVTNTIICSGNRRNEMNVQTGLKTDGLSWGYGAISTGQFEGFKLAQIYNLFGINYLNMFPFYDNNNTNNNITNDKSQQQQSQLQPHCILRALDAPFDTSLPLSHILNPQKDVLLALSMNNEYLNPDQGYPVKFIAPGCTGNRQVKWIKSISLQFNEALSPWHQSTPYRHTGPATTTVARPTPNYSPPVYFWPVFSNITYPTISTMNNNNSKNNNDNTTNMTNDINTQQQQQDDSTLNLNPSQQLIPSSSAATITPHQCRSPHTLASLKVQLTRQQQQNNNNNNNININDITDEELSKLYQCIDVAGYSYVGNGIGISRVDTAVIGHNTKNTNDNIKNDINDKDLLWTEAKLQHTESKDITNQNPDQSPTSSVFTTTNNHWSWSLFESEVILPSNIQPGDEIIVTSKAIDNMFNSQPRNIDPMWNSRGILNNGWCQHPIIIGQGNNNDGNNI